MKSTDIRERLREVDRFFQGKDQVHKTMRRVVKRLEKAGLPYVVAGGMAVVAQGYQRTTKDVDILLTPQGLAEFRKQFVPKKYSSSPGRSRRFVDPVNDIPLDILVTGAFPGSGQPGPITYPDPAQVGEEIGKIRYLNLETLIQLKLAARRYKDFADVAYLIRAHNLDESFADRLHPSLRQDYIECLEEERREEEYEARNG